MSKILIYQLLPRLFGNHTPRENLVEDGTIEQNGCGHFCDLNSQVLSRIRKKGFTHIWLTGVVRHATTTDYTSIGIPRQHPAVVKGKAGSPYAICDYYDVDPDLTSRPKIRMGDFHKLIDRAHKADLRVVVDFVPNHVARQYRSVAKPKGVSDLGFGDDTTVRFAPQNNFYYCPKEAFAPQFSLDDPEQGRYAEYPAKVTGNDCFTSSPGKNDWYETVKINYGIDYAAQGGRKAYFSPVPITWKKMKRILIYWAEQGIDAFRCDMAEMVPPEFWEYAIASVKKDYPRVEFIAEVYNPSLYHRYLAAGFDWLYDKVGMYDTMRAVATGQCPTSAITRQWQATDDIRGHMLYFMENHDEQRIASDFFAGDGRKGVPASAVCMLLSTNAFMLYAGQEFGERGMDKEGYSGRDGRTTLFDYWSLQSLQHGFYYRSQMTEQEKSLEDIYQRLTTIASGEPAITTGKFFDLMYVNPSSESFDADRMYTFLRSNGDQTLLVTANFSAEERDVEINIPDHAFNILGLDPSPKYHATDLLVSKERPTMPSPYKVRFHIAPYGVSVLSLHYAETRTQRHHSAQ